jgi:hypothetical protein
MKVREWNGEKSKLRIGWYADLNKHADPKNKYHTGKIFQESLFDPTVKLVDDPSLSGMAAFSSSGMAALPSSIPGFSSSGKAAFSSRGMADVFLGNSFNEFARKLDPIKGLTFNGNGFIIDTNTELAKKSGATIISGFENDAGFFEIALKKNDEMLPNAETMKVGMDESQSIAKDDLREFLVKLVNQKF